VIFGLGEVSSPYIESSFPMALLQCVLCKHLAHLYMPEQDVCSTDALSTQEHYDAHLLLEHHLFGHTKEHVMLYQAN